MVTPYIPNTASIPNILFDYWMPKLNGSAFKILMAIARKTYGWNKGMDAISVKQLEKMTGLHRSGVINHVQDLVNVGIVIKIQSKTSDGDSAPNQYIININLKESNVENLGTGGLNNRLGVVESLDHGVVESLDPQNPLYTKPTNTKEIAQTAARLRRDVPEISFSFATNQFEQITDSDLKTWKELYPSIEIERELKEMTQWILSNPTKAKSKKLWRKFVLNWLQRSNEKATNQLAYRQSKQKEIISRHTGLQKDHSPINPDKILDCTDLKPLNWPPKKKPETSSD